MDLIDLLYKLARKSLPVRIWQDISRRLAGRSRSAGRIETHAEVFDHYRSTGRDFRNRIVVEVGSGDQYYTALFFLHAGAREVLLVDPRLGVRKEGLAEQARRFQRFTGYATDPEAAEDRIFVFNDLAEIPWWFDEEVDFLCSHLALEHLKELRSCFVHARRLLRPGGVSHHKVDLSDHTYHVFSKYPLMRALAGRRSLHHLRYSDSLFEFLNDDKCFMNRKLLPEYLELARKFGFSVRGLECRVDPRAVIHRDLFARYPGYRPEDFQVVDFSIDLG